MQKALVAFLFLLIQMSTLSSDVVNIILFCYSSILSNPWRMSCVATLMTSFLPLFTLHLAAHCITAQASSSPAHM
jgi:hypothetical protein